MIGVKVKLWFADATSTSYRFRSIASITMKSGLFGALTRTTLLSSQSLRTGTVKVWMGPGVGSTVTVIVESSGGRVFVSVSVMVESSGGAVKVIVGVEVTVEARACPRPGMTMFLKPT